MLAFGCTKPERLARDVDPKRGDATGLLLNADYAGGECLLKWYLVAAEFLTEALGFFKPVTMKDGRYHL
jgi:hypothetical protein